MCLQFGLLFDSCFMKFLWGLDTQNLKEKRSEKPKMKGKSCSAESVRLSRDTLVFKHLIKIFYSIVFF